VLSSLFEIPAQLAMLLSLAASTPAHDSAAVGIAAAESAVVEVEPPAGPLQFGEHAWLRALHDNPDLAGRLGARVFVTSGGRFYVPTAADRQSILAARNDAPLAARVARAAAGHNAALLGRALRRTPCSADLYLAHLMGPEAALAFIEAADAAPDRPLGEAFPALAAALPKEPAGDGAPVTVGQLYRRLRSVLYDPPRLVAIGLRPSLGDIPPPDAHWRTKVEMATIERRNQ